MILGQDLLSEMMDGELKLYLSLVLTISETVCYYALYILTKTSRQYLLIVVYNSQEKKV